MGCPYCSGKKILIGFNDLESKKPELLLDWDYNKNKILPNEIHYNSFKEVNWKCHKCGFEWQHNVIEKNKCPKCVKNENIINVYDLNANFIGRYDGVKSLCKNFDINPKSHGNISSICERKQKTLKSKYLLRYNKDDEFKGLNNKERKKKIDSYLGNVDDYKYKLNPQINIYDIIKKEFVKQCNNLNEAFDFLEIKSKSNIVTVCKRKQKTIKNRYILRYDVDDEFKNLTKNSLKKAIDGFIGNYNYFKNR